MSLVPPRDNRPWMQYPANTRLFLNCDCCGRLFTRPIYQRRGSHDYCSRPCASRSARSQKPKVTAVLSATA